MNRHGPTLSLPIPPKDYREDVFRQWKRNLEEKQASNEVPGDIVGVNPILLQVPDWGYRLVTGAVWADENGFLRIVRAFDVFAPRFTTTSKLGRVTVAAS